MTTEAPPLAPPDELPNASPADRSRLRITGGDVRLLGCCLAGFTLLAIMTGPPGSSIAPVSGITGSLHPSHLVPFLVVGVLLWIVMTVTRKVRAGEIVAVTHARESFVAGLRRSWDEALHLRWFRWTLGGVTLVAALFVSIVLADLTGPFHVDKVSPGGFGRQFQNSYTYGYVMFAAILWWLSWRRVLERHGVRAPRVAKSGVLHKALVIVACLVGGLVVAITANPWLDPAFHSSDVALAAKGSTIFGQWPTYFFLAMSLVIAWRILRGQSDAARHGPMAASSHFVTPQLRLALYVTALFVAIEWPKFLAPYWQSLVAEQIGIFVLLALGLNVVVGFAGLLDLGYVAFYAVGAYTGAYFTGALPIHPPFTLPLFLVIPVGILTAMLAGVLLGLPTLRLRGDYLAIVTLGFGAIIATTLNDWTTVTYGSLGTNPIPPFSIHILGIHYVWDNFYPMPYYYLILAFIIGAIFAFSSLNNSRVGRRWAAIREDEVAGASIGVNPLKYKVMAFAIGASTAGFAGVFYASIASRLFPVDANFGLIVSILILALVIFGGMGNIGGVMAGAAIYYWLYLYLQLHPFPGYDPSDFYMYVGAMFVLLMIFRPQGLFPARRRAREFRLAEQGVGFADPMSAERGESDQFEGPSSDEGSVMGRS